MSSFSKKSKMSSEDPKKCHNPPRLPFENFLNTRLFFSMSLIGLHSVRGCIQENVPVSTSLKMCPFRWCKYEYCNPKFNKWQSISILSFTPKCALPLQLNIYSNLWSIKTSKFGCWPFQESTCHALFGSFHFFNCKLTLAIYCTEDASLTRNRFPSEAPCDQIRLCRPCSVLILKPSK